MPSIVGQCRDLRLLPDSNRRANVESPVAQLGCTYEHVTHARKVSEMEIHGDSPEEVAAATANGGDSAGDAADQAERLSMVMEAEAVRNALNGASGEGSLDGLDYPLDDTESTLAMEDADDSSDDPMHAGGLTPRPWIPAEEAAMHTVDDFDPAADSYLSDETDSERADPNFDQYDEPEEHLTPEDETLLGIDPYDD